MRRWFAVLFATAICVSFTLPAFSQSCSLCYTQAASAAAKFIEALRNGILVLLVPPLFISAGITYLAYRKRNQFKNFIDESKGGW